MLLNYSVAHFHEITFNHCIPFCPSDLCLARLPELPQLIARLADHITDLSSMPLNAPHTIQFDYSCAISSLCPRTLRRTSPTTSTNNHASKAIVVSVLKGAMTIVLITHLFTFSTPTAAPSATHLAYQLRTTLDASNQASRRTRAVQRVDEESVQRDQPASQLGKATAS